MTRVPLKKSAAKKPSEVHDGLPEHFFKKFMPETRPTRTRACDHPACSNVGEYRAPKLRELEESDPLKTEGSRKFRNYYMFCLDHVTEYNAQWDYYKGMSVEEMENAIKFDGVWNRQTFSSRAKMASREKKTRDAFRTVFDEDAQPEYIYNKMHEDRGKGGSFIQTRAEIEALKVLGLEPPTDFPRIKKRYHTLVKKHHPDMAAQADTSPDDDDMIKRLNGAFTVLKAIYGVS